MFYTFKKNVRYHRGIMDYCLIFYTITIREQIEKIFREKITYNGYYWPWMATGSNDSDYYSNPANMEFLSDVYDVLPKAGWIEIKVNNSRFDEKLMKDELFQFTKFQYVEDFNDFVIINKLHT